jgi:hypothetical protein
MLVCATSFSRRLDSLRYLFGSKADLCPAHFLPPTLNRNPALKFNRYAGNPSTS